MMFEKSTRSCGGTSPKLIAFASGQIRQFMSIVGLNSRCSLVTPDAKAAGTENGCIFMAVSSSSKTMYIDEMHDRRADSLIDERHRGDGFPPGQRRQRTARRLQALEIAEPHVDDGRDVHGAEDRVHA